MSGLLLKVRNMNISSNYSCYESLHLSLINQQTEEKALDFLNSLLLSSFEGQTKEITEIRAKCLGLLPLRLMPSILENSDCSHKIQTTANTCLFPQEENVLQASDWIPSISQPKMPFFTYFKSSAKPEIDISEDLRDLLDDSQEDDDTSPIGIHPPQPININPFTPHPQVHPSKNSAPSEDFNYIQNMQNEYGKKISIIQKICQIFSKDLKDLPNLSNQNGTQTNEACIPPEETQCTASTNSPSSASTSPSPTQPTSTPIDCPPPNPTPGISNPEAQQPTQNINLVSPAPATLASRENLNSAQNIQNEYRTKLSTIQKVSEYAKKWWYFFVQKADRKSVV